MKRIFSIMMLMALLTGIAIAQERTPDPEIYVEEGECYWVVTAIGEGEVHLYKDLNEVENPYTIELTDDEQYYVFGAYAKAEGCFPSNFVEYEVNVPPYTPLVLPVHGLHVYLTDDSAILEPFDGGQNYIFWMIIEGEPVDVPCVLPRGRVDYVVPVEVIAGYEDGYGSFSFDQLITVPAMENYVPDVNGDDVVNIADLTAVIDYLFGPRSWWIVNIMRADVDGDEEITIADVSALIDYLIKGAW